jgi:hypothetical protein
MNRNRQFINSLAIGVVAFFLVLALSPMAEATASLTMELRAGEYEISSGDKGERIEMEGYGYLMVPGKPLLPAKNFLIALPPGARVKSVEVKGIGAKQLSGTYRIEPTPPILPLIDPVQHAELVEKMEQEWQTNNQTVYSSDQSYPSERGRLKASGTLRKYSYASVSFYPFSYHPQSSRLIRYDAAHITINYELPSPGSSEAQRVEELKWDDLADERASKLFINYQEVEDMYQPAESQPMAWQDTYDYVIITTGALQSSIVASDFLNWKASLGYNVRIVLTTDAEIAGQAGVDLAAKVRNFLRYNYLPWGIEYVLLVGDYATIPMRYCYPDSDNHANGAGNPAAWPWSGDVPTDYYYADLSDPDASSWDSDGDGYYAEYGQDHPDFLAEVYVGRIPTNNSSRITYTLNKLVSFEQDTGAWKQRALHAGAIAYFANEDHSGRALSDGASILDSIEANVMISWQISHYSEQGGLGHSPYDWPALSEAAFIGDWRNGQYGVVNWSAHGWSDRVARKIWVWDDGDGVPETSNPNEMSNSDIININSNLDDDYPSIVFAVSCMVGYPEPNAWGNLGIDLLTEPSFGASAGIVSGSRVVWVSKGGGELLAYEFNRFLIDDPGGPERVGEALFDSKFFCNQNYTWNHYSEYWNMFCYNLFGDPSLAREGAEPEARRGDVNADGLIDVGDVVYLINYLFKSGPPPNLIQAGDANCDSNVDIGDVVYLINYLFKSGPSPSC